MTGRSLTFLALLLLPACRARPEASPDAAASRRPDEVTIEPASYAYVELDTVHARTERVIAVLPAHVALDEEHTVRVFPPVTGRIRTLNAAPGDPVTAGQALAHITSGDLAQATSDLAKAEAVLSQSDAALTRAQDLFDHHILAGKDLEQARSDEAQARAERDRARQRADLLGAGSSSGDDFVLRSPIAGEVIDRSANPGAEVRPDAAVPLFTVSALDTLWLTAGVYERDLASVRPGERLAFTTDAMPGRRFTATVQYVSGALDPATRTATLRASLPNPGRVLRAETFGEASLLAHDAGGVPAVPSEALITRGNGTIVFVRESAGRFLARPVTVTDDDGQFATVSSGLQVGDVIAGRGALLLANELPGSR